MGRGLEPSQFLGSVWTLFSPAAFPSALCHGDLTVPQGGAWGERVLSPGQDRQLHQDGTEVLGPDAVFSPLRFPASAFSALSRNPNLWCRGGPTATRGSHPGLGLAALSRHPGETLVMMKPPSCLPKQGLNEVGVAGRWHTGTPPGPPSSLLSGPGLGLSTDPSAGPCTSTADPPTVPTSLPRSLGLWSEAQWGDGTWAHSSSP